MDLTEMNQELYYNIYYLNLIVYVFLYLFTEPLHHGQDMTQGQFLSEEKLIEISVLCSSRPVA